MADGSHTILGIITVAKSLTRQSSKKYLLGEDELEQSEIDQWLYFCQSNIATADSFHFKNVLKVNCHCTFLANSITKIWFFPYFKYAIYKFVY